MTSSTGKITTENNVRPELLESPWLPEDGVIREYMFASDLSIKQRMEVWEFNNSPLNQCLAGPCFLPCHLCTLVYYPTNKEMYYENQLETLYSRRLAVTKDGVATRRCARSR